jgi:hypothetical protein
MITMCFRQLAASFPALDVSSNSRNPDTEAQKRKQAAESPKRFSAKGA